MKKLICLLLVTILLCLSACSTEPAATATTGNASSGDAPRSIDFESLDEFAAFADMLDKSDEEIQSFLSEHNYWAVYGRKDMTQVVNDILSYPILLLEDSRLPLSWMSYSFTNPSWFPMSYSKNNNLIMRIFSVDGNVAYRQTWINRVAEARINGGIIATYTVDSYELVFLTPEEINLEPNDRCWESHGYLFADNYIITITVISRNPNMTFPSGLTNDSFSLTTIGELINE